MYLSTNTHVNNADIAAPVAGPFWIVRAPVSPPRKPADFRGIFCLYMFSKVNRII